MRLILQIRKLKEPLRIVVRFLLKKKNLKLKNKEKKRNRRKKRKKGNFQM
jgi:hypothetical protein